MAKRTITGVAFNLAFNVLDTPPRIDVQFTDHDDAGRETQGTTTLVDGASAGIVAIFAMIDQLNAAIEEQAAAYAEPGKVAERITAASEAERRRRDAEAAKTTVDTQVAAATAELAEKMAAIALANKAIADLSARDDV